MTDSSNLKIVQGLYEDFGLGDLPKVIAALHPDVEWSMPGPVEVLPYAGIHRGPEAVMKFFDLLLSFLAFESFEVLQFIGGGDTVVVIGRSRDRILKTDKAVENDWVSVIKVLDGRIHRYQIFEDTAAFVAAATP